MSSRTMVSSKASCFSGLRLSNRPTALRVARSRTAVKVAADGYLGSPTNLIMVASTALCLAAGRFGLAPTSNRQATAGLKLVEVDSGLKTGDPSGFNAVDVLALGSFGHIVGVGIVMGLKGIGQI